MAISIVVLPPRSGIWFGYGPDHRVEVVYRSGPHEMLLDQLDERPGRRDSAQRVVERHGRTWTAHRWRKAGVPWEAMK